MSAKKIIFLIFPVILITITASAQTAVIIKGRVIGQNMEELEGISIVNLANAETVSSNKRGFFNITAAKGDTLVFKSKKYSGDKRIVKRVADHVDVIMIMRKTAALPAGFTVSEYNAAARADDKLYNILEKGAEREGLWNY